MSACFPPPNRSPLPYPLLQDLGPLLCSESWSGGSFMHPFNQLSRSEVKKLMDAQIQGLQVGACAARPPACCGFRWQCPPVRSQLTPHLRP